MLLTFTCLYIDNGSNCDRSNRSSLQSCTSSNGSGHGTKRNSSNLYINNPNSLEVETAAACLSPDGNVHRGSYHYANYDYGHESGGGGGGGGIPGMAQLVIHNPRVINSSQDAIPRSVSVPLSRSNSRKESTSVSYLTFPVIKFNVRMEMQFQMFDNDSNCSLPIIRARQKPI